MSASVDVVVPTLGRPSLRRLLDSLAAARGPAPGRVILVDDRSDRRGALLPAVPPALAGRVVVLPGGARGPAAARNVGWRASDAAWVAFLDDDVAVAPDWLDALAADLAGLPADVAGSQGRISVPLPSDRRPTDWERNVAGLASARWATADLAYRRAALAAAGGFDERFPRAYREDADLGLRLTAAGWRIVAGRRRVTHPVRPADRWISVRLQRGNADDALMRALHGRGWRERAGVPRGRRRAHLAVTSAGIAAAAAGATGRRRAAALAGAAWLAGTGRFAWARIAPGPRTPAEVATMLATSAVLPTAATGAWLAGWARVLRERPRPRPAAGPPVTAAADGVAAVLFDRDGTLVVDEPYNGDPGKVRLMPGAADAVARVRNAGVPIAVVSNQSGIGRGLVTRAQVDAVNRRVEELLGPVDAWVVCPHTPDAGCDCRKPAPGMVLAAATALGVEASRCAVVGDIGADVGAALAAGARPILVPTAVTRDEEVAAAPEVAPDLPSAVTLLLGAPA